MLNCRVGHFTFYFLPSPTLRVRPHTHTVPCQRHSPTTRARHPREESRHALSRERAVQVCTLPPSGECTRATSRRAYRDYQNRLFARCASLVLIPAAQSHMCHGLEKKVYTPASHVLCMRRAIPYHVTFTGPPLALATLLTYMPSRMGAAPVRACSGIQLLRQISVDVK